MLQTFHSHEPLALESGGELPGFTLAFTTLGSLNADRSNVVWVCHALTADSNVAGWWPGLVGEGKLLDPSRHFLVCANVIGSCYGSTGPLSVHPITGEKWYHDFPRITLRDIVAALDRLRIRLGIDRIKTLIGGSLGGQQAIEWAITQPSCIEHLVLIATNARHSPWGIAWNESQLLALHADPTFHERKDDAGIHGLKAARSIALLSYRNAEAYNQSQQDDEDALGEFRAASYQRYQGEKLAKRFNAFSYATLAHAMSSHNVGRGRGGVERALSQVTAKTFVIGIEGDVLFPLAEQQLLANHIPDAEFLSIASTYGHDGFLLESDAITQLLKPRLSSPPNPDSIQCKLENEFRISQPIILR